jgi:hypothetical protein
MLRWRRQSKFDVIKEYLNGFGEMFHVIDAKLEEIVELLRDEEDDD